MFCLHIFFCLRAQENPGVGPALGTVVDPENGSKAEILWADGGQEIIKRKYIRFAPKIGEKFEVDGVTYEAEKLLDRGVRAFVTSFKQTARKTQERTQKRTRSQTNAGNKQQSEQPTASKKQKKPATQEPKKKTKEAQRTKNWRQRVGQSPVKSKKSEENQLWVRCRAPSLDANVRNRLVAILKTAKPCLGWTPSAYLAFCERCMQEYVGLQKSKVHLNRRKVLKAAIGQAMAGIRPRTSLPHDGSIEEALEVLLPVAEKAFVMQVVAERSSDDWVDQAFKDDDYTFEEICEWPKLRRLYIAKMILAGKKSKTGLQMGYPKLRPGEKIPTCDDVYVCDTRGKFRKYSTKPHRELPYFRGASASGAIEDLKNWMMSPVTIRDAPNGIVFENGAECLWAFHASYCNRENWSRTSDEARSALVFTFYGTYTWITKKRLPNKEYLTVQRTKPILFWLHKKVSNGRSRFVFDSRKNFAEFIKECKSNDWFHFLDDKGAGSPPDKYLWLVEDGLRRYASDVHAMGTNPLRSETRWSEVAVWRKREAYIAVARHLLDMPEFYKTWTKFRYTDYTSRQILARTFEVRHLPLSDGLDNEHFGGEYSFDWDAHMLQPRKKKRVKSSGSSRAVCASATQPMTYDVEKGRMVPLE